MQDLLEAFGEKVKLARIKRGYTQVQLAEKLHTSDRTISKIEKGQTNISLETAKSYAIELEFSIDDLIQEPKLDRVSRCVREFFTGMDEGKRQIAQYLFFCDKMEIKTGAEGICPRKRERCGV